MVSFTKERSIIFQDKLPPELEDPGSFTIPCAVGDISISGALCDLEASMSLMSYSICKRLQVGELKPTTIFIQLARSIRQIPYGDVKGFPFTSGEIFHPL